MTPMMREDKALALTITQIGGLTSILPVAYGMSNVPPTLRSHHSLLMLDTHDLLKAHVYMKLSMIRRSVQRSGQCRHAA